jgi:hypothetical protein
MSKNNVSLDEAIEYLNALALTDPVAVRDLIAQRVPCNDAMRDHPTVQVEAEPDGSSPRVGVLGVLNGLFGVREDGWGEIAALYNDDHSILLGFERTPLKAYRTGK